VTRAPAQAALETQFSAIRARAEPVRAGEDTPRWRCATAAAACSATTRLRRADVGVDDLPRTGAAAGLCQHANLMLVLGSRRQREMSVRLALGRPRGASSGRCWWRAFLLAAIGGASGWRLAIWPNRDTAVDAERMGVAAFPCTSIGRCLLHGCRHHLHSILFGLARHWPQPVRGQRWIEEGGEQHAQRKGTRNAAVGFQIALSTLWSSGRPFSFARLSGLNAVDPDSTPTIMLLVRSFLQQNRYPAARTSRFISDWSRRSRPSEWLLFLPPRRRICPASGWNEFCRRGASDPNRHQAEAYNALHAFFGRWVSRSWAGALRGRGCRQLADGRRHQPESRQHPVSRPESDRQDVPSACTAATATY